MIGYLFLFLALVSGLVKGFSGKTLSREVFSLYDGVAVNTLRTILCALIGLVLLLLFQGFNGLAVSGDGFIVCLCSSVFMATFCISWLYAYHNEAYVFLSVFTMLASIVTGLLGWIFFNENIKTTKIIGMAVLIVAVYFTSIFNKKITGKITLKGMITLILGGLSLSLADFMQKVWVRGDYSHVTTFTFYTYALTIVPQLLLIFILRNNKSQALNKKLFDKKHLIIFIVISVALFSSSLTKTLAATYLDGSVMYPTLQAANLIATAALSKLILKEQLSLSAIIGVIIAILGIVLMNI